MFFWVPAESCDGSLRTALLVLSFLVAITSFGTDVGDVGAAEFEEPVGEPRTTICTQFFVLHFIRLPSLMRCDFRRVFRVRERLAYLREALLSRINPIL